MGQREGVGQLQGGTHRAPGAGVWAVALLAPCPLSVSVWGSRQCPSLRLVWSPVGGQWEAGWPVAREELAPAYNAPVPALCPSIPWPRSICPHHVLGACPRLSWSPGHGGEEDSLLEPPEERAGNPQACGGGDKQERVKGLGPLAFDGAALRGASPPPSSFRCRSAPRLAPNRKHNTHLTGRGCA